MSKYMQMYVFAYMLTYMHSLIRAFMYLLHCIAADLCIFYSQGPGRLCSSSLVLTGEGGWVLGLA